MVQCVGKFYGPLHHVPQNFLWYLCLLCAWYDDVLEIPTQKVLEYHMRWWNYLGSYCLPRAYLTLGLWLRIRICYNLNRTEKSLPLGPQKMMRWTLSLPILCSCLGLHLSTSHIPCLSDDYDPSHQCMKYWRISWGLGSASKICCIIHPQLDKI